jgi:catechol 2,3-dioxygenase-like lactoylglutathione lyase family enzyme
MRATTREGEPEPYPGVVSSFPALRSVVLDATDARALAEFYRQLLGYTYRPGDEAPPAGQPDPAGQDWLVLVGSGDGTRIAFQQVDHLAAATWPDAAVPQQLHLDLSVPSAEDLVEQHQRVLALGATLLLDRFDDPDEPLYVYADPAGHPFCVFVAAS